MNTPQDSYSAAERRFLAPARRLLLAVYAPLVALFARLPISPNLVSFSQVIVAGVVVYLIPVQPRLAFGLFVVAVVLDGLDGALARATHRVTHFGGLFDQYCDHIREIIIVSGFALYGVLNPFLAGLYGLTYPAFNLTLYLCNIYGAPLPVAIKSYLIVYPAIFGYLWFGLDLITAAVFLSITFMGVVIAFGLWRLQQVMDRPSLQVE